MRSFCEGGLLGPEASGQASVRHTARACEGACSQGTWAGGHTFALSLCLATTHWCLPKRSLYTCLEPWFLQLSPRAYLQLAGLWWIMGLMLVVLQDVYLYSLNTGACVSGFQSAGIQLLTEILFFESLTGPGTPSTLGSGEN